MFLQLTWILPVVNSCSKNPSTHLYKVPQLTVYVRAQTSSIRLNKLHVRDRVVLDTNLGKNADIISASLRVPMNSVASSIVNKRCLESPGVFLQLAGKLN